MNKRCLSLIFAVLCCAWAGAADWPQYRADAGRSGYSPESLPKTLTLRWSVAPLPPQPAWQGDDTRMPFDHAYHPVIAGGRLFFGSSADTGVHALDAATGEALWTFFTGAPVRFAPAVWRDKVFAVSDDGYLYCLGAQDGALLWKKRGGPGDEMLLGNDRMISRWPARGGPAIADDTLYFAAGIWPSEGIYLYAVDPETGTVRWCNDTSGGMTMDQPHGTATAQSGVSIQGYLTLCGDTVLTPTGRAVPAAFNRNDGAFRYFRLQEFGQYGGYGIVAADNLFVNAGVFFDTATGALAGKMRRSLQAVSPQYTVWAGGDAIAGLDRAAPIVERDAVDRKGNPEKRRELAPPAWKIDVPKAQVTELILAGETVVYATDAGDVVMIEFPSGKPCWQGKVEGAPLGLAVAEGRLYVATDRGAIHCFAKKAAPARDKLAGEAPYGDNAKADTVVKEILDKTGVVAGYCLLLDAGDGALAYALAKHSELSVYALEADSKKVRAARERLAAAGVYGTRVTVHAGTAAEYPYPRYFPDLVIADALPAEQALELVRPYGGVACVGAPGALGVATRGPLEGAGEWTHQYATPANPAASGDTLLDGALSMLWFRDSDFEMPSRHGRGPAPLFWNGIGFVEGLNAVRAFNAYNGRPLWEFSLPDVLVPYDQEHLVGTAATGSNICVAEGILYVRTGTQCYLLDASTGAKRNVFALPAHEGDTAGTWGFLACEDGRLFGSVTNTSHIVHWAYQKSDMGQIYSESSLFFAMDARSGEVLWQFAPKESIRHNAIAIGGGRVYLVDRPLELEDRLHTPEALAARRGEKPPEDRAEPLLYALDAASGKVVWKKTDNAYGTLLALSEPNDILLMTQQHTRFKLPSEKGGLMTALRASDGTVLWETASDPQDKSSRPVIIGTTIYNEPGAWDLLTGARKDFHLARSYGCGIVSGCQNMMFYRSATLGYVDLNEKAETINYGGIRPGCWINAIPAGGLLLMPDATARCTCSYLIRANAAFQTVRQERYAKREAK